MSGDRIVHLRMISWINLIVDPSSRITIRRGGSYKSNSSSVYQMNKLQAEKDSRKDRMLKQTTDSDQISIRF